MLAVFAAASLLISAAAAESIEAEEIVFGGTAVATETDGYHFDGIGFLTGDNPGSAYLLEDAENGTWQYSTEDLSIRVTRFEEEAGKRKHLYCVAEVYASEKSPLFTIMTPGNSKRPGGYYPFAYPEDLVRDNPVILAMSDDYYGYRQYRRDLKRRLGLRELFCGTGKSSIPRRATVQRKGISRRWTRWLSTRTAA